MKKIPLNVCFSNEKLDALRLYLNRKNMNLEQEIDEFLEKSYQKIVPSAIRDFISVRQLPEEKSMRKSHISTSHSAKKLNSESEVSAETDDFES